MFVSQSHPCRRRLAGALVASLAVVCSVLLTPVGAAAEVTAGSAMAPPSQPLGVAVVAGGKRQLTATWDVPAELNGAEVTGYTVTFRTPYDLGGPAVEVTTDVSAPREATATGLTVGWRDVTVVAHSTAGDSPASAVAHASAYDDPFFDSRYSHFNAMTLEPNDLWVSWGGFEANGSTLDHYEFWASYDTTAPIATFGNVAGGRINGLLVGQPFTLTVVGVTAAGLRASMPPRDVLFPAAPVATSTPPAAPVPPPTTTAPAQPPLLVPAVPARPTVRVLGHKAVVTWTAPSASAKASRYIVTLVRPDGRKVVTVVRRPLAVLKRLAPGRHKVSVMAGNDAGWSRASRRISFRVG